MAGEIAASEEAVSGVEELNKLSASETFIRSEGADVPAPSLEELWTPGKAKAGSAVTVGNEEDPAIISVSPSRHDSAVVGTWYRTSMAQNYEGILGSFP